MPTTDAPQAPPFCPNPACRFHRRDRRLWRFVKDGFFARQAAPRRIQRYRCVTCRRHFSSQTFATTYWLKRPDLLEPIFHHLVACSGYRQVARMYCVSPQTVLGQSARLGRHCLLFHQHLRPRGPWREPAALDSFESFEFSHYHPTSFHLLAGQRSHFCHGFTASEIRRKGRMTRAQKTKRARLEAALGRPDPRAVENDVATLLAIVAPPGPPIELHSDQHSDYPRALRRLHHLRVTHRTISSRAARTPRNPLFPLNLLDLLIRHCGANHKRQTIAFSKRRQSAIERLWVFLAWRNYAKSFSERHPGESPAMRLGLLGRILSVGELLLRRLFPGRIALPDAWLEHYRRLTPTRSLPRVRVHALKYAF